MHISGTQRLFSVKYLFGEAKLPRIFCSLRKTKNLLGGCIDFSFLIKLYICMYIIEID